MPELAGLYLPAYRELAGGKHMYEGIQQSAAMGIITLNELLCVLKPWLGVNFEVSIVGVDRHEEVVQEAL